MLSINKVLEWSHFVLNAYRFLFLFTHKNQVLYSSYAHTYASTKTYWIVRIETREIYLRLGDALLKGNHGYSSLDKSHSIDLRCSFTTKPYRIHLRHFLLCTCLVVQKKLWMGISSSKSECEWMNWEWGGEDEWLGDMTEIRIPFDIQHVIRFERISRVRKISEMCIKIEKERETALQFPGKRQNKQVDLHSYCWKAYRDRISSPRIKTDNPLALNAI